MRSQREPATMLSEAVPITERKNIRVLLKGCAIGVLVHMLRGGISASEPIPNYGHISDSDTQVESYVRFFL
ncbi:hypothetical protein Taro_046077 [Colocasia esculenta]|uniref:Uncharacterized protein n=1 Tax=Colocasia esculenta TaxID=4460 RepID=A0A843X5N3_COLES|nr:hypothetical protein [Colocasia esculenta]